MNGCALSLIVNEREKEMGEDITFTFAQMLFGKIYCIGPMIIHFCGNQHRKENFEFKTNMKRDGLRQTIFPGCTTVVMAVEHMVLR